MPVDHMVPLDRLLCLLTGYFMLPLVDVGIWLILMRMHMGMRTGAHQRAYVHL